MDSVKIGYIGGSCDKKEQHTLKKLVFRAMRGKAYMYFFDFPQVDLNDSLLHGLADKAIFLIVYQ